MIECVDCEEYLREIDRLESRLAAALDALREIDGKIGHFRSLESEVTFPLALIPVCAGIARAALAGGGR